MNPFPEEIWRALVALQLALCEAGGELHVVSLAAPGVEFAGSTRCVTSLGDFVVYVGTRPEAK